MTDLKARFVIDPSTGKPAFVEQNGVRHYKITLSVENASGTARGVTYNLHESYYDPVRDIHDPAEGFREEITSYGDFDVLATVQERARSTSVRRALSRALESSYPETKDADILRALKDIKEH